MLGRAGTASTPQVITPTLKHAVLPRPLTCLSQEARFQTCLAAHSRRGLSRPALGYSRPHCNRGRVRLRKPDIPSALPSVPQSRKDRTGSHTLNRIGWINEKEPRRTGRSLDGPGVRVSVAIPRATRAARSSQTSFAAHARYPSRHRRYRSICKKPSLSPPPVPRHHLRPTFLRDAGPPITHTPHRPRCSVR